jgi:hypothetical protein
MSDPATYSAVQNFLGALAADSNTGITAGDVTALLAMAATTIPWWKASGYPCPFSGQDIVNAGLS